MDCGSRRRASCQARRPRPIGRVLGAIKTERAPSLGSDGCESPSKCNRAPVSRVSIPLSRSRSTSTFPSSHTDTMCGEYSVICSCYFQSPTSRPWGKKNSERADSRFRDDATSRPKFPSRLCRCVSLTLATAAIRTFYCKPVYRASGFTR